MRTGAAGERALARSREGKRRERVPQQRRTWRAMCLAYCSSTAASAAASPPAPPTPELADASADVWARASSARARSSTCDGESPDHTKEGDVFGFRSRSQTKEKGRAQCSPAHSFRFVLSKLIRSLSPTSPTLTRSRLGVDALEAGHWHEGAAAAGAAVARRLPDRPGHVPSAERPRPRAPGEAAGPLLFAAPLLHSLRGGSSPCHGDDALVLEDAVDGG